jgi:hypothetical protein
MRFIPLRLSILAFALSATALPAQQVLGRNEETFNWSDRVGRGDWFRIIVPMGEITVTEGSGSQVEVRARKVLRRGRVEDVGFSVVRERDGITFCAIYDDRDDCDADGYRRDRGDWGRNRQYPGLEVSVRLPAGVHAQVQTGNGAVSISGASGEVIARSGNGRVDVNGSGGDVQAASGNGEVTVQGARGEVQANSGNGDVTVRTSRGPVSAGSGNGDLIITMDALANDDDMEFTTGNGRIRLNLPADFTGEIDASSGNGSVVSDFPIQLTGRMSRSRVRGTVGGGGNRRIRMNSGNGVIELRRGGGGSER